MGQKTLVDDLREELARGEVLVIVGSGVSIQATSGADGARSWMRSLGKKRSPES